MTIVVGVDHTTESGQALDLAVREAELRGADLRILHVGEPVTAPAEESSDPREPDGRTHPSAPSGSGGPAGVPSRNRTATASDRAGEAQVIVEEALFRARRTLPPDRTSGEVSVGRAAKVLVEQVTAFDLLVVGSRNLDSGRSALLGSVGASVVAHAPCPVIVARHAVGVPPPTIARVLAGTDGSPYADRTLEFAFAEAQLRGIPLDVVRCWRQHGFLTPYEQRAYADGLRDSLESEIDARIQRYPGVEATGDVYQGHAAEVLAARANEATLVVIGARGAGGMLGSLLLGSVSRGVLQHAHCPVAVVRPTR